MYSETRFDRVMNWIANFVLNGSLIVSFLVFLVLVITFLVGTFFEWTR